MGASLLAGCTATAKTYPLPRTTGTGGADWSAPAVSATAASATSSGSDASARPAQSDRERAGDSIPSNSWLGEDERSYVIPGVEIVAFEFGLTEFDRHFVDKKVFSSNWDSIKRNFHSGWVIDKDPFSENQFGHPYTGSLYHGFARSAGLDYWEALGYDFAGSALWELAGETTKPSLNDQVNTSFAGSFLGEALFRTSNWMLEGDARHDTTHEAVAALVCPSAAVNRYAWGDRFDKVFPSHDPAVFYWAGLGARRNTTLTNLGLLSHVSHDQAVAEYSIDYGMPGKPGYTYDRPFDYFHFDTTASSSKNSLPESIQVRGLLVGSPYESGNTSGVYGLYGTYDYFSPEIFKVSSTGASFGTTLQDLLSDDFALQGAGLLGGGFTAAGTNANSRTQREYHYSASPQALVSLRLAWSDVAMLDLSANDYVLTGSIGSSHVSRTENVIRASIGLTFRVYERHAIGLQFIETQRRTHLSGLPNPRQNVGALTLFYTYLGDEKFGVVRK